MGRPETDDPDRLWFTSVSKRRGATTLTRIDYIFVSSAMLPRTARYKVETCEGKNSDHRMVHVTVNSSRSPRNMSLPSIDARILPDPDFQDQIRAALATFKNTRQDNPRKWSSPSDFWESVKKELLRIGLSFAKKQRQTNLRDQRELIRLFVRRTKLWSLIQMTMQSYRKNQSAQRKHSPFRPVAWTMWQ